MSIFKHADKAVTRSPVRGRRARVTNNATRTRGGPRPARRATSRHAHATARAATHRYRSGSPRVRTYRYRTDKGKRDRSANV